MDRLNLTLDIQSIGPRRVNVRSSLVVANLIATIKDKFNLDGSFELRWKEGRRALSLESALDAAGVADGHTLGCVRTAESTGAVEAIQRGERAAFSRAFQRVYVAEDRTDNEYEIGWQPAIIGRTDRHNPSYNRLLAVDLGDLEDLPTVSRHHACLTEHAGAFSIESLQGQNPTYVDGVRLRPGQKFPLHAGAKIQVGRLTLTFHQIN
jgi:FHA domain-containing protein